MAMTNTQHAAISAFQRGAHAVFDGLRRSTSLRSAFSGFLSGNWNGFSQAVSTGMLLANQLDTEGDRADALAQRMVYTGSYLIQGLRFTMLDRSASHMADLLDRYDRAMADAAFATSQGDGEIADHHFAEAKAIRFRIEGAYELLCSLDLADGVAKILGRALPSA